LRTWLVGPLGNVARVRRYPGSALVLRLLRRARCVVVETPEADDEVRAVGFRRIALVPIGLEPTRFAPFTTDERAAARRRLGLPAEGGVLVYCGRFDLRQKRVDLLVDGWRAALPDGWHLVLVGDGPDRACVEQRAAGIDPPIVLTGWLDDVRVALAAADAFALPTAAETTGMTMLEGLACGLPGLVSATPGIEARKPGGVVLVDDGIAAWSAALTRLCSDAETRRDLAEQGRAWVSSAHDPAVARRQWRELLA
jgi:glycosyltransferase involved in cell wall biosynthesis